MKDKNKKTLEGIKAAFKTAKDKLTNIVRTNNEDSYVHTEVIYNTCSNFIVFISFSEDKLADMVEFLEACKQSVNLKIAYDHLEYEEDTDKTDENGNMITVTHKKYYLLIGGKPADYIAIYHNSANLANDILLAISKEIANRRDSMEFETLIKDGIFNGFTFKYQSVMPEYDEYVRVSKCHYDNVSLILERLPHCFTGSDLIRFVNCYDSDFRITSAYDMLAKAYLQNNDNCKGLIETIFSGMFVDLFGDPSEEVYMNLLGPRYLIVDSNGLPGDKKPEELDEIFREEYEKFNAIMDLSINYEDIDEILNSDDIDGGDEE